MRSPFPGMDPFLEHPAHFPDLHDSLIAYLRETLNRTLPRPYFAGIASRIWVEGLDDETREPFVEIYSIAGDKRLVTSIEVLSISNKMCGAKGRELYSKKQRELLECEAHLVEIDLLRGGEHTSIVPLSPLRKHGGAFDYHVCVHRFDAPVDFAVYPIRLRQRLPTVAIPLLPNDDVVRVDLQAVFDRCYATGRYERRLDYKSAVVPPLTTELDTWAKQMVAEWNE